MRLEEICTVFTDGDWIESKDQSDDGIRLVQTGNIGEGIYLEKEARAKYISEETFEKQLFKDEAEPIKDEDYLEFKKMEQKQQEEDDAFYASLEKGD